MPPTVVVAPGLYLWTLTLANGTTRTVAASSADSAVSGNFPSPVTNAVRGGAFDGSAEVPPLVVSSLNPTTVAGTGATYTQHVLGTGFRQGCEITWDGTARSTTFVSATELTLVVNPPLETVGTHQIGVRSVVGLESNTVAFTIT